MFFVKYAQKSLEYFFPHYHQNHIIMEIISLPFFTKFCILNMPDGAIGYLENDMENLKIFDVISNALKPGGAHVMDICRAEHAELYFPKYNW